VGVEERVVTCCWAHAKVFVTSVSRPCKIVALAGDSTVSALRAFVVVAFQVENEDTFVNLSSKVGLHAILFRAHKHDIYHRDPLRVKDE
jgi:hypothetical protein